MPVFNNWDHREHNAISEGNPDFQGGLSAQPIRRSCSGGKAVMPGIYVS